MLDDLKRNYRDLPDRWKAALRTAWQTVLASVAIFLISALDVLRDLVAGDTVDVAGELLGSGRVLGDAVLVVAVGLITLWMNRNGGAAYDDDGGTQ